MTNAPMDFRVLGPLDVRVGDEPISLGGGKQRAVLAVLLLRAGEVVPIERLVDEVWGNDPPPSAAHTLESYVSRLRQLLNGHGPRLVRKGAGYALELGDAALDARRFVGLQEQASLAAAMDEHADVMELTAAALEMWRGPALADVALASAGRAEADRLEELRLRTHELRFDAELALSRHEQAIGELQSLVAQNPYRERFVAQLMLALYRAGRHADALEVYEQTRRRLDDDLGLQPSSDLQQLSGQVVRQDSALRRPTPSAPRPALAHAVGRRTRRVAELVVVGSLVAAVMAFTASGSAPGPAPARVSDPSSAKRVALVFPADPDTFDVNDTRLRSTLGAFDAITLGWGREAEVLVVSEHAPRERELARATNRIATGNFDLVVVLGGGDGARQLAPLVPEQSTTRFVFIGASVAELALQGVANATGLPFADQESAELVGYLSGIVAPRGSAPLRRATMVSVVVAQRTPHTERVAQGFRKGVRRALPSVRVQIDYAARGGTRTECEAIANRQIAAGSEAVFALGRPCARAVAAVARIHGVWALGTADDGFERAPHVLAYTYREWGRATRRAMNSFQAGTLPAGRDVGLGLADDYAVGLDTSDAAVSKRVWEMVVKLCSRIRQHTGDGA